MWRVHLRWSLDACLVTVASPTCWGKGGRVAGEASKRNEGLHKSKEKSSCAPGRVGYVLCMHVLMCIRRHLWRGLRSCAWKGTNLGTRRPTPTEALVIVVFRRCFLGADVVNRFSLFRWICGMGRYRNCQNFAGRRGKSKTSTMQIY